jgi:CheY-like chemotaxis protein
VTLAADGNAALQLVQSGSLRPDLVLLDLDMPGLRGDEVQRRLLELQPTLRIVFASGHISPDVERTVLEAGALAFLGKPVASQLLLATVDDALGRDD